MERLPATADDPLRGVMAAAPEHPSCVRLLVRCALGDLRPAGFPACLDAPRLLSAARAGMPGGRRGATRRSRLCRYAGASLLLGWVTFEGFLVAATGLARVAAAGVALGSAIWGQHLRSGFGLSDDDGIESGIADLARVLAAAPKRASGVGGG